MMVLSNNIGDDLDEVRIQCQVFSEPERCRNFFGDEINFKMISLNVRSITKNFDQFNVFLSRLNVEIDLIILTECWLSDSTIIPQLPGYTAHKTIQLTNQNSGVIAYIKTCWNATVSEPDIKEADCLQINLGKKMVVLGIYRSPSFRDVDNFLCSLDTHLNSISSRSVVIAGDININILEKQPSASTLEYLCFMAENGFLPAITEPTREVTCIDHIYIKGFSHITSVGLVCKTDITDHDITVFGTSTNKPTTRRTNRFIIKRDIDCIINELKTVNWADCFVDGQSINTITDTFTKILMDILEKHTRKVKLSRSKHNLKPWITPGLMRCMRHRDKLHLQSKLDSENKIAQVSYKRYRNFFTELLRKLRSEYENSELLANKDNPKKLWKTIKNICNLNKSNTESSELLTLVGSRDDVNSLNQCNTHFTSVGQGLASKILLNISKSEEQLANEVRVSRTPAESFFMQPTDCCEVDGLIRGLANGKAPGIDGISNSLLKDLREVITSPLTDIFNISMATGTFPQAWKLAVVCPIFKSGCKVTVDNYRPISLLIGFSKLLEKLVNNRLVKFLDSRDLLSDRQFGFRKKKSTEEAVSLLTSKVSSHLDKKECCVGVFLDLAKAFDTVSAPILLKKLESMGVRGCALDWFGSYLQGRRQRVRVGTTLSDEQVIHYGVPQGSILGPTLFIMYINDIHTLSLRNSEILCYADDTAIVFSGVSWDGVFSAAEEGMSRINSWLERNLLTLNTKKTMYACFHKTSVSAPPSSSFPIRIHTCGDLGNLTCSCATLTRVHVIKYLGVLVDENLSFKLHISALSSRIRKVVHVFRQLRDVASLESLRSVYFALCQSLIMYCITCWGSAAKTVLIQCERAQRSVLKTMLKRPRRHPTADVYQESGMLSVRKLFILKTFLVMHKTITSCETYKDVLSRRIFRLPKPQVFTTFAQRFGESIKTHIYNAVVKLCVGNSNIGDMSPREVKLTVQKWLLTLDYDYTESILAHLT